MEWRITNCSTRKSLNYLPLWDLNDVFKQECQFSNNRRNFKGDGLCEFLLPWAPKTMKNKGLGHLNNNDNVINHKKTSKTEGFRGPWYRDIPKTHTCPPCPVEPWGLKPEISWPKRNPCAYPSVVDLTKGSWLAGNEVVSFPIRIHVSLGIQSPSENGNGT